MSDDRPIVYQDGDKWVYRASAVGLPVRCLSSARQGYDPLPAPQYLMDAAEAGSAIESVVIERLQSQGWDISGLQNEIEVPVDVPNRTVVVRGHMDGMDAIDPADQTDRCLEVKSMSGRVFKEWIAHRFDRFPEYADQLTTYMTATGKPAVYAVINRDDPDDMEVIRFESPPRDFTDIANRVKMIEALADMGQLPRCVGGAKYRCPYDYLCDRNELAFRELEDADEEMLITLCQQYQAVRQVEEDTKVRKANIRDEIIVAMAGQESAHAAGWKVAYTESERKTLDTRALRDELGERLDDFYKTNTYRQLRVTPPKRLGE